MHGHREMSVRDLEENVYLDKEGGGPVTPSCPGPSQRANDRARSPNGHLVPTGGSTAGCVGMALPAPRAARSWGGSERTLRRTQRRGEEGRPERREGYRPGRRASRGLRSGPRPRRPRSARPSAGTAGQRGPRLTARPGRPGGAQAGPPKPKRDGAGAAAAPKTRPLN